MCVCLSVCQCLCTCNDLHRASTETDNFLERHAKIHRIKINHIWIQISYSSPYEAYLKVQKVVCVKTEKIAVKFITKGYFQKSQKLLTQKATFSEHPLAIHSISIVGCVLNSLTGFCLSHTPSPVQKITVIIICRQAVSVIFKILPCAISLHFSPFRHKLTFVFEMCLLRSTIAYMRLNMTKLLHYDAVDFSVSL